MDKRTKKTSEKLIPQIIDTLVDHYGMTAYYIRQCVAGRREGITPDRIKKDYRQMAASLQQAINNYQKN